MSTKTTVDYVSFVGGSRHDEPSNIMVDERTSPFAKGRGRGNLYIVVELTGPAVGRDLIAGQLTQAMRRTYYEWRGSVTAGLQQAIRQANDLLIEENRTSLPGERRLAGASCAVLRSDDLFLAQAGPSAVYVLHQGQLTRFPDSSPWLDGVPPEEMDATSLGERREVRIDLFHSQLGDGDTVLLADTEFARGVVPALWPQILSRAPLVAVLHQLQAASKGLDLSAVVLRVGEDVAPRIEAAPVGRAAAPAVAQQETLPVSKPAPPRKVPPVRQPAPLKDASPTREPAPAKAAGWSIGDRIRAALLALAAMLTSLWAGFLSFLKRMVPGQVDLRASPAKKATPVRKVEAKPVRPERARRPAGARSEPVQRLLLGVAIAIPIIVAAVVLVAWFQRSQAQQAELQALWQQANAQWEQARTSTDVTVTRASLAEAERSLGLFLERRPEDAEAIELQKTIQARSDVINQVRRITQLAELNSYPADAELTRIVVQGAHLFVLDRRNGQVYHHRLDEQLQNALVADTAATVLVSKGQQVDDVLVGDLVDMAWMPTGPNRQQASLVILESGGTLLDYDPATGQLRPLRVAATDTWQFPKLVGSHSGRFYLLDSSANKILRYDPTADGYSNPPEEWLQTEVDLAGVIDMAIGDSIYLLYADGNIRRLALGQPAPFDISDWDTPPRAPVAIFARPAEEAQWVYVADRGNSRIVQLAKEGRFQQQFRLANAQAAQTGDPLGSATAFFVDEIGGRAYVTSGQKLYLLTLPMSQ